MKLLHKLTCIAISASLLACHSGQQAEEPANRVLETPPFAALSDSIREQPDNPGLYLKRAALLNQQGEHELAMADLELAWKLAPSESLAEARVNNLFMMGKSREALALLDDLMKQYPGNSNLKRRMGEALMQSGQVDQAIASYEKLITEDSLDFEAYYEKGLLYLQKKDTGAALKDLESSFRLQPIQLTALSLANLYAEQKNPRALELADLVISRDSARELIDPVFIKGIYYANTGKTGKALEQFNQVISMDWKFNEAYIEKGIIYFEQKNLDEALKQFKLASTVSNTFPDAYYWQGRCYEQLGMAEEAIASYSRAYALDKSFTEALERAENLSKRQ